jgi:glycerophosphoryl diester phosphodiesterase
VQRAGLGEHRCLRRFSPATRSSGDAERLDGSGKCGASDPLTATWLKARKSRTNAEGTQTFFVGAHRGGCQTVDNCGVSENTPESAILGTQLGSDYLEYDVALTADDVPVVFHVDLDPALVQGVYCVGSVEDYTYDQLLANCRLRNGEIIPRADTDAR